MTAIEQFWAGAKQKTQEACALAATMELQPRDNTIYLCSLRAPTTDTPALSLTGIKLAGQRLQEGSHRVATDAEIKAYLDAQSRVRERIRLSADEKSPTFVASPPPRVKTA